MSGESGVSYFPGEPPRPVPDVLTADEAIRYLRLDQAGVKDPKLTLDRYRRRGLLRGTQISRIVVYLLDELRRFLREQTERNPR